MTEQALDGTARLVGHALLLSAGVLAAFALVAVVFAVVAYRRRWLDCTPVAGPWAGFLLATLWLLGVLLVGAVTAPQVGTVWAVAGTLDDAATALIAEGLVHVGTPLGIEKADQKLDLQRYAALADRLVTSPGPSAAADDWTTRFWSTAADGVRAAVRYYAGTTAVTPNDIAAWAWKNSARPALRAFAEDAILADVVVALAALAALAALVLGIAWSARRARRLDAHDSGTGGPVPPATATGP